jgi:hypothetical protein
VRGPLRPPTPRNPTLPDYRLDLRERGDGRHLDKLQTARHKEPADTTVKSRAPTLQRSYIAARLYLIVSHCPESQRISHPAICTSRSTT